MKKLIPILFLLISVPVFADTAIPTTPAVADFMITAIRPASYTASTPECKTDRLMVKSVANDYYNSVMSVVEKWKVDIEASRQLTPAEKKDYDYVKSIFMVEKNTPKAPTWKICDVAMDTFKENLLLQTNDFNNVRETVLSEYTRASTTIINTTVKTFNSKLNKVVAIVNSKDVNKNSSILTQYDVVIKITTNSTGNVVNTSVMMKNSLVNNKMASFYGFKIPSVSVLSLQKVYTSYVSAANQKALDLGKQIKYPKSMRLGVIYYVEK